MHKVCGLCKEEKRLESFSSRSGKTGKLFWCKTCYGNYNKSRSNSQKKLFIKYCGNKCKRCGIKHTGHNSCIFDFHHKDPSIKDADWGRMRRWKVDRIRPEIKKCILLCSNCHRLTHRYLKLKK